KVCSAGSQNRHSEFKSRPKEFAAYTFLINNLRKARSTTLGHYWFKVISKEEGLKLKDSQHSEGYDNCLQPPHLPFFGGHKPALFVAKRHWNITTM
ncbi:hypothetical protein, partial [Bradyrhizobium sp.]|uniref:hypothetical protein n=1 Tax=Bradyrhizobium sp. TaxID=376 RepID=UPI003C604C5A